MPHALIAALLAVLVCSPLWAQVAPEADRSKQALHPERSRQESDFRQVIKQRDEQVAARAEVQRIINFADGAASRVNRFFDSLPSGDFAGDLQRRVQSELARLDRAEPALPNAPDARRAPRTTDAKGASFSLTSDPAPPRPNRVAVPPDALKDAVAAFHSHNHGEMMAELRTSLTELRQNLSQKHLYWAANFEGFMSGWELQLRKASGANAIDVLRPLYGSSNDTNGSREQWTVAEEGARSSIAKYRDALRLAADNLRDRPPHSEVRHAMLTRIKAFSDDIKAVGSAYDEDMRAVERGIVSSAKATFGANLNSEVFLWLLMVFGGIFLLIMISPMFYARTTIAENLLKAEFLLQFSTVFILTAAIIILGIGGFIGEQHLPVLLAGISGYVLGQLGKPGSDIVRNAPDLARVAELPKADPKNDNPPPDGPGRRPLVTQGRRASEAG